MNLSFIIYSDPRISDHVKSKQGVYFLSVQQAMVVYIVRTSHLVQCSVPLPTEVVTHVYARQSPAPAHRR